MAREFRLERALLPVAPSFDYVLIDCPPSLGLLTINGLTAAQEVIVPVQCEYLALEGLGQLMHTLDLVRRNLNQSLRLRGLLLTMYDGRTNLSSQVAEEVRTHFSNTFEVVIPRSVRLSEAPSHGLPVCAYDPSNRGAQAYEALADETTGLPVYQLIAGERRLQAARLAGLERVPVVVREASSQQVLEIALVENLQRADLNA